MLGWKAKKDKMSFWLIARLWFRERSTTAYLEVSLLDAKLCFDDDGLDNNDDDDDNNNNDDDDDNDDNYNNDDDNNDDDDNSDNNGHWDASETGFSRKLSNTRNFVGLFFYFSKRGQNQEYVFWIQNKNKSKKTFRVRVCATERSWDLAIEGCW